MKVACRYSKEGSLSTQSQGSSSGCQEISSAPPPRILLSFPKVHAQFLLARVSTGRCRFLQEDAVFLQEDAVFLEEDVDFLQESANFLQEALCSIGNFL